MSRFRFWGTLVVAIVFGTIGFLLGSFFKLPAPFTPFQSREFYALAGFLIGILSFGRMASWVVRAFTHLIKNLARRFAFEIINQFTQIASRGWPFASDTKETSNKSFLGGSIIVDTSSVIDGRILDVAKTGFLSGILLVPNFVLTELQQVADSVDNIKRTRGRRGFEVINDLKKITGIRVEIWDKDLAGKTVDDKLIRLGKILRGKILTCDFNLNRVATLSGISVLNMNDLANALKTLPIPGEKLNVKIIQSGKDRSQGVGYLADGTMVVVKDAVSLIGKETPVEVTRLLQGPAGRMIFGVKAE